MFETITNNVKQARRQSYKSQCIDSIYQVRYEYLDAFMRYHQRCIVTEVVRLAELASAAFWGYRVHLTKIRI